MLASVRQFAPYFEQKPPKIEVLGIIAELDLTHEDKPIGCLVCRAMFAGVGGKFLSVQIYGPKKRRGQNNSPEILWPRGGTTYQQIHDSIEEVHESLNVHWVKLREMCDAKGWAL